MLGPSAESRPDEELLWLRGVLLALRLPLGMPLLPPLGWRVPKEPVRLLD